VGAGLSAAPLLSSGDVVAGRFRIVRFLAGGGMGEVYEAHDRELDEPVALKTLRPELIADGEARERFRREVQLARKVSHPDVCRTFDVFRHPLGRSLPDGRPAELTLLSMELLPGETLADRLRRGPLSPEEALPLVRQMAGALQAAHDAGVVHRDFKSANVMLVPGEGGTRAVVTDFGLARAVRQQLALTGSGALLGTPAYMAPEQLSAGEVGPAADVYALGVVLFEMVTGARPFEGDTPFATALQRLASEPRSPRTLAPHLDARWEATILRCLARDPGARFGSVSDVPRALVGERLAFPLQPRPRWPLLAALLATLLGAGGWLALRPAPAPQPLSAAPVALRLAVAVLGLRNLAGEPDSAWLSTALAEMLEAELRAGGALRVVPGERVARMTSDLSLPAADRLSRDRLQRVRAHLGVDMVVTGSYLARGGALRVDLRVQDASSGETLASASVQGTVEGLLDVVSRTGSRLREGLSVTEAGDAGQLRAAEVGTPEAARLYAEGLERLRAFDAAGARERLERAVELAPDHPLLRVALARAWAALGEGAQARAQAQAALPLARRLSREERLRVEGRAHEAAAEWDRAAGTDALLWDSFPDEVDHGLRLCATRVAQSRGGEALATVQALGRLPAPLRDDPRIALCEAEAAQAVGDLRRQRTAAVEAARRARGSGVRLVVAQARYLEARALRGLGDPAAATQASLESQQLFAAAGDVDSATRAAQLLGSAPRSADPKAP
jgi:TolB-like protein